MDSIWSTTKSPNVQNGTQGSSDFHWYIKGKKTNRSRAHQRQSQNQNRGSIHSASRAESTQPGLWSLVCMGDFPVRNRRGRWETQALAPLKETTRMVCRGHSISHSLSTKTSSNGAPFVWHNVVLDLQRWTSESPPKQACHSFGMTPTRAQRFSFGFPLPQKGGVPPETTLPNAPLPTDWRLSADRGSSSCRPSTWTGPGSWRGPPRRSTRTSRCPRTRPTRNAGPREKDGDSPQRETPKTGVWVSSSYGQPIFSHAC